MKTLPTTLALAFTLTTTAAIAQSQPKNQPVAKDVVHTTADVMPEPTVNVQDFLAKNLDYPKDALKQKVEGRVVIRFVVAEDGSLTDAMVERGVDPALDAAALATVKKMGKWRPGSIKGKPVKIYYRVPVSFKLS